MCKGEILLRFKNFSVYAGSREVQFEHLYNFLTSFVVKYISSLKRKITKPDITFMNLSIFNRFRLHKF